MVTEAKDKAVLDAALQRYLSALNALNEEQFMACFRENCIVRDPYGSLLYEGQDGLHNYFRTLADTWQAYIVKIGNVYYGGRERIVFPWEVEAVARSGKSARFDGVSVITLEGDLIDGLEGYWDAAAAFEQIRE